MFWMHMTRCRMNSKKRLPPAKNLITRSIMPETSQNSPYITLTHFKSRFDHFWDPPQTPLWLKLAICAKLEKLPKNFLWSCIRVGTCVSAFREIHQSLQCKIFQYTFFRQYPMKFWDSFSLCKIQEPAWLQLDHKKFKPSEVRCSGPYIMKLKKTRSHVRYTSLKNIDEGTYWIWNLSRWIKKVTLVFTNF